LDDVIGQTTSPTDSQEWKRRRNTFCLTTLTFFHWLRSLLCDTILRICSTGLAWWCETSAGKTTHVAAFGNVRTTSAGSGKSFNGNLLNVAGVVGQNTAVRIARRMRGCIIDIGVTVLPEELNQVSRHRHATAFSISANYPILLHVICEPYLT